MASEARAAKRQCTGDPLNAANLTPAATATLHEQFAASAPYTHVVLHDLCDRAVLREARDELIANVEAKFKETDLFKVCTPPAPPANCSGPGQHSHNL